MRFTKQRVIILAAVLLFPVFLYISGLDTVVQKKSALLVRRRLITAEQDKLMNDTVNTLKNEINGTSYRDLLTVVDTVNKLAVIDESFEYDESYFTVSFIASHNPYKVLEDGRGSPMGVSNLCCVLLSRLGFSYTRPAARLINHPRALRGYIEVKTTDGVAYIDDFHEYLDVFLAE